MKNIRIQNIAVTTGIILVFLGLGSKYQKYGQEMRTKEQLQENKRNIQNKISQIISENEKKKEQISSDYEQIQLLSGKISTLSLKNEAEFKKMIYVFSRESDLKMKEISKSEKVWERNGYSLKYIHFTLSGSLNDFGKFLYFVNKSRKYIDTSKMYIELTSESFKISLGFIEKNRIKVD